MEPVIEADQDPVADQDVVVEDPLISEEDEAVVLEEHIPYQLALVPDQVSLDEDDESGLDSDYFSGDQEAFGKLENFSF